MSQNGKGDKRRPKNISYKIWEKNYERIFGKGRKNSSQAIDNADTKDIMKEQRG